jgi:hypothetical protein
LLQGKYFLYIKFINRCSEGIIHDFAGSYYVNKHAHKTGFGKVTKYLPLELKDIQISSSSMSVVEDIDEAIENSSKEYNDLTHNLFLNNCHSHVAKVLNHLSYKGIKHWNTFFIICLLIWKGKFVSWSRFFQTYFGFFLIIMITFIIILSTKSF